MTFLFLILMGVAFYFLYKKGIIKKVSSHKSEETKNYVRKKADEKYKNKEISKEQYEEIKKDLEEE
ncbi:MAG: hypothetical protein R6V14_08975 [Halanaerobiales bacterium]